MQSATGRCLGTFLRKWMNVLKRAKSQKAIRGADHELHQDYNSHLTSYLLSNKLCTQAIERVRLVCNQYEAALVNWLSFTWFITSSVQLHGSAIWSSAEIDPSLFAWTLFKIPVLENGLLFYRNPRIDRYERLRLDITTFRYKTGIDYSICQFAYTSQSSVHVSSYCLFGYMVRFIVIPITTKWF